MRRRTATRSSSRTWPPSCGTSASSAPTWAASPWAATSRSTSASRVAHRGGRSGRAVSRAEPLYEAPHRACGARDAADDWAHGEHRGACALQSPRRRVPRRGRERALGHVEGGEAGRLPSVNASLPAEHLDLRGGALCSFRTPPPASSERALHPDGGAWVVVVARDLREAGDAVEMHGGLELRLGIKAEPPAAEVASFVEGRVQQPSPNPQALACRSEPHTLELARPRLEQPHRRRRRWRCRDRRRGRSRSTPLCGWCGRPADRS